MRGPLPDKVSRVLDVNETTTTTGFDITKAHLNFVPDRSEVGGNPLTAEEHQQAHGDATKSIQRCTLATKMQRRRATRSTPYVTSGYAGFWRLVARFAPLRGGVLQSMQRCNEVSGTDA